MSSRLQKEEQLTDKRGRFKHPARKSEQALDIVELSNFAFHKMRLQHLDSETE